MDEEATAARKERQREYQRQYRERRKAPPTVVQLAKRRVVAEERLSQVEEFLRGVYRRPGLHNRNTLGVRP